MEEFYNNLMKTIESVQNTIYKNKPRSVFDTNLIDSKAFEMPVTPAEETKESVKEQDEKTLMDNDQKNQRKIEKNQSSSMSDSTPKPLPTPPSSSSVGGNLSYDMTIEEFRNYVSSEENLTELKEKWDKTKKIPGYVVYAALLGGPKLSSQYGKVFVEKIAGIFSNGKPSAGTWSSAVAKCINNSRMLEAAGEEYPKLDVHLTVAAVKNMFAQEINAAFISQKGRKDEILEAFGVLFLN